MRLTRLLPLLILLAPAPAMAGTYSFAMTEADISVGALDPGSHPAFFRYPSGVQTRGAAFPTGAFGQTRISLPSGSTFRSLSGTLRTIAPSAVPTLDAGIRLIRPDGQNVLVLGDQILPFAHSFPWTMPAGYAASVVRISLFAKAAGRCDTCTARAIELSGQVDDVAAPSAAISSALTNHVVRDRVVPISWSAADTGAGPGSIYPNIDGARGAPVRAAPGPNPSRLTGQWSAGAATISGVANLALPDADGPHRIWIDGFDGVGNGASSAAIAVTLDRQPPSIQVTTPSGWCSASCPVAIQASDTYGVQTLTADINGIPLALGPAGGAATVQRLVDARVTGIQGAATIHVRAVDVAGNLRESAGTILIDSIAPILETIEADPVTRVVRVGVRELSGIRSADVSVAGARVGLAASASPTPVLRRLVGTVPTGVGSLEGAAGSVTIVDDAGNAATASLVFRVRATIAIRARLGTRLVAGGKSTTISGTTLSNRKPIGLHVLITLTNSHWPEKTRSWAATSNRSGAFRIKIRPRLGGIVTVRYAGSETQRATVTSLGRIRVRPTIKVKITQTRTGLRATGAFLPSGGPPALLIWQARRPGRPWLTICRDQDTIRVSPSGSFRGRCRVAGLSRAIQIRVAYRSDTTGAYG